MRIFVNGESVQIEEDTSVGDLVAAHLGSRSDEGTESTGSKRGPAGVAVALNAEVIPRSRWAVTRLGPDDRVEILGASQGG